MSSSPPSDLGRHARRPDVAVRVTRLALRCGQGRAKLSFTLAAGKNAARLKTITIALPKGLGFSRSKKDLAKGSPSRLAAYAQVHREGQPRELTVTLKPPTSSAQVTISSPAITVSGTLAKKVKDGKVKTLSVLVTVFDTDHRTTGVTLKLRAT